MKFFIIYLYLCKRKRTHNIHAHVTVGSSVAMTREGNNSGSSEEKYKEWGVRNWCNLAWWDRWRGVVWEREWGKKGMGINIGSKEWENDDFSGEIYEEEWYGCCNEYYKQVMTHVQPPLTVHMIL